MGLFGKKPRSNLLGGAADEPWNAAEILFDPAATQSKFEYDVLQSQHAIIAAQKNAASANQNPFANVARSMGTYKPDKPSFDMDSDVYRMQLLGMRLRVNEGENMPFDYIATALSGETVFVFILTDGKPAMLEDAATLFPSDTLITQLRLIAK